MKKIMKIKLFCLLFFFSLFSMNSFAQNVSISLSQANTSLLNVLNEIEKQATKSFVYNVNDIDVNQKVSISVSNQPLEKVMEKLFAKSEITYTIVDSHIVLKSKEKTAVNTKENNTPINIKGKVVDEHGDPLTGVSVGVPGSTKGAFTDIDGNFTLSVNKGNTIQFSYIGFKTQSQVVQSANPLKIVLAEDSKLLDEVVVTALGIKRETKALSYNVQEVKGDQLVAVKDANMMNSLNGKIAGVQISSGATGPGGATRIVMRGMKSLSKDNNALYVIDGVPMFNTGSSGGDGQYGSMGGSDAVADLNPDDVESISMMTGPSAAALYGSSAANGVVLINTKKGKEEKLSVTVSNSTMFSSATMMPDMQSRYGSGLGMSSWGAPTNNNYNPKDFFNTGTNIINSVSLSTGTARNKTYISASTTNSAGILPNNKYDRYNFTARNTANFLDDKLTLDVGAQYILQSNKNMVSQGQYYNPLPALYLFPRGDDFNEVRAYERYSESLGFMKQYWPYGEAGLSLQNPYWTQYRNVRTSDKERYILNASLNWKATEWLNFTGRVNVDNSNYENQIKKYATTLEVFSKLNGGYDESHTWERAIYLDILGNVDKTWGDYRLNANFGASLYNSKMDTRRVVGNLIIPNFFQVNNIDYSTGFKTEPEGYEEETQSIFTNLELSWKNQIYLTVSGRNEWASALAFSGKSSFFYPSVGLSGLISEMAELPDFITFAKVRGSYTEVGTAFDRFLTNPGYEWDSQTQTWKNPTVYPMDNMKPERTKSWELGLNMKFWESRISLDATYYNSATNNQTFFVDIPSSSGYTKAIVQAGKVVNKGLELALGYKDEWGDVALSSTLTFTTNKNRVKKLADGEINPVTNEVISMPEMPVGWLGQPNVAPRVILTEGGTMTDIYVYQELAKDANGNIKVDPQTGAVSMATSSTPTKLGNLNAKYNLGWSNNISYKGINLGFVITARVGGLAYSGTQGVLDYYGVSEASAHARDNGGVPVNKGMVDAEKYYKTIGTGQGGYGKYYTYSATNVRLQELSLNYTLPKKWLNNVANVTVGLVARNLWMIYCKAPFDPELSAATSSNYYMNVDYFMQPSLRNVGFNVKVQF